MMSKKMSAQKFRERYRSSFYNEASFEIFVALFFNSQLTPPKGLEEFAKDEKLRVRFTEGAFQAVDITTGEVVDLRGSTL